MAPSIEKQTNTPAPAVEKTKETYTIIAGDTLGKIAKEHNTSIATLTRINKIANINKISIGQKLEIPTAADTAIEAGYARAHEMSKKAEWKDGWKIGNEKPDENLVNLSKKHKEIISSIKSINWLEGGAWMITMSAMVYETLNKNYIKYLQDNPVAKRQILDVANKLVKPVITSNSTDEEKDQLNRINFFINIGTMDIKWLEEKYKIENIDTRLGILPAHSYYALSNS